MKPLIPLLVLSLALPAPAWAAQRTPGATVSFEIPGSRPPAPQPTAAPASTSPTPKPTRSTPRPAATPAPKSTPRPQAGASPRQVDERPLWRLWQQKRLTELRKAIAAQQKATPGWRPPAELMALLQAEETRQAIQAAIQGGDPLAVVNWAQKHPRFFDAAHLSNRWAWLDALKTLERRQELQTVLAATLKLPLKDHERVATLQKAAAWLDPEEHRQLLAREMAKVENASGKAILREDLSLVRLLVALEHQDDEAALQLAVSLDATLRRRRDPRLAVSVGWLNFRLGELNAAQAWFQQALAWSPRDAEAREGLALTLLGMGHAQEAERIAKELPATEPRRARLLSALLTEQAASAYHHQRYAQALELLARAESHAPLPPDATALRTWTLLAMGRTSSAVAMARSLPASHPQRTELLSAALLASATDALNSGKLDDARRLLAEAEQLTPQSRDTRLLHGWIQFKKAEYDAALESFLALYDATLDPKAGEGVVLSALKAGQADLLKARRQDPTLAKIVAEQRGREAFALQQYAKAYAEAPHLYPSLSRVHFPSLATGISRRSRSGEAGTSNFQVTSAPAIAARLQLTPSSRLDLAVDHYFLDNGTLATASIAGTMPVSTPSFRPDYYSNVWDGYVPVLNLSHTGSLSFQGTLSTTPNGGPLGTKVIGEASLRVPDDMGGSTFGVYSRAVTESRLSWIGMEDPYQPGVWGQVLRNGVRIGRDFSLSPTTYTAGELTYALLRGAGVAENDHAAMNWRLRQAWQVPFLEAFAGSAEGMVESYRRNLSGFTRGHGGYFSPQIHGRLRLGLEARSPDLRPFVVSLRLGAGPSYAVVSDTPYFPLSPDGRSLPGYERLGIDYDGDLRASVRLMDALTTGVSLSTYRNSGYAESQVKFFARWLLGPRRELTADDLID